MLNRFPNETRQTVRTLVRSRVFTFTAVASIAIGVAATTGVFAIANALLLDFPPGIGAPERLIDIGRTNDGVGFDTFSYPNLADLRSTTRTLENLAAAEWSPRSVSLGGRDGTEAITAGIVGGNFFEVLRARPALGRFFLPADDNVPGARPVVVLSHDFWAAHFQENPEAIGSEIRLNGSTFTVIGVAAEGFRGPFITAPDLWAPVMASTLLGTPESRLADRRSTWLIGIGRLAPGADLSQARAELNTIAARLERAYPEVNEGQGVSIMPASLFPGEFSGTISAFMAFLLSLSVLVLLVAATNVAGMMLARAAGRQREMAVRLAIGASRHRLLAQLVTESLLLFLVAGGLGVVLARWVVRGLLALVPPLPFELAIDPAIDARVVVFALGISAAVGLLAGLAPGIQGTRPALAPVLRGVGGTGGHRQRLRGAILVAQMAFSMLLLVVAGLLGRALVQAQTIDIGFDPVGVEVATLDLRLADYQADDGLLFTDALVEGARALPGVEAAAMTRMLPLDGGSFGLGAIDVAGREPPNSDEGWAADWNIVTPGYLEVMRIPLLAGRAFDRSDNQDAPDVAIINQTLADRIWPDGGAVGKTFRNGDRTITVVGVARDAKYSSIGEAPRGFVYVPLAQRYASEISLLARTVPGVPVAASIRRLVAGIDPALPIVNQETLVEHAALGLLPQRIALWIAATLGFVALILGVVGIYGVTAFSVARRTREIGIRIALGARPERVLRLILRQGITLTACGLGIGLVAALGVTRLIESLLFGVSVMDGVALGGAAGLLIFAALLASWFPARRAARVDPVDALRSD